MSFTTRASGFIVFREEPRRSFLLMEHPSRLDLPKGHIDDGETDLQCALRELEEETGIGAQDLEIDTDFCFTTNYKVRYKRKFGGAEADKTLVIFLAWLLRSVDIRPTEHTGFRWVEWEPPHAIQAATIDPLLAQVADHLQKQKDRREVMGE